MNYREQLKEDLLALGYLRKFEDIVRVARLVVESPPRSAQLVRLVSKLKEKIEELDRE